MKTIADYLQENVSFTPAVIGYLIRNDKVLLGLRKKVSSGMGTNLIAGIGGKVGDAEEYKNETDDEALIREMREEITVTPTLFTKLGRVRFIWPDKLQWSQEVRIYTVQRWSGEATETHDIKPMWFPMNKLPFEQMWEDNIHWVPQSIAGEKVDKVFMIGNDNKTIESMSIS